MQTGSKDVDEYLATITWPEGRAALERLRAIVREEAPEAEECTSYGIPTYKLNGMLASFAAFKNHLSFFPGHTVRDFADRLHGFKTQKGTVQFTPDKPIPEPLLREMLQARKAELASDPSR